MRYKWNEAGTPKLTNTVGRYRSKLNEEKEMFDAKLNRCIEEGIMPPWEGKCDGLLPLMAVQQPTNGKARPELDYRELNKHVSSAVVTKNVVCHKFSKIHFFKLIGSC